MKPRIPTAVAVGLIALGAASLQNSTPVQASDHNEPQSINAISPDVAPDAADVYGNFVWPTEDSIVLIITFPGVPFGFEYLDGSPPETVYDESHPHAYDDGVLYTVHIDRDLGLIGDRNITDAELSIHTRFGYDAENREWGVKVEGIPGEDGPIVGPVNTRLEGENGTLVQAGLFDEPFFVDLERFFQGLETADLAFRPDVDFFEGYNVKAIVIEVPKEEIATPLRRKANVWVETHRLADDPHIRPGNECGEEG